MNTNSRNLNDVGIALKVMDLSGIDPSIQYSLEHGKVFKTIGSDLSSRRGYLDHLTDEEQVILSLLNKLGCFVYHILQTEYEECEFPFKSTSFFLIPTLEHYPQSHMSDMEHSALTATAEFGVIHAFTISQDCGCGRCGYSAFEEINVKSVNGRLTRNR